MKTYHSYSFFKIIRTLIAPLLTLLGIIPISGKKMQANCSINAFIHAILPSLIHKKLIFSGGLALVMSLGAWLPLAMGAELEFVTEVAPSGNIKARWIDAMLVLNNKPNEIIFTTDNQGAYCGGGTPASAWKLILDSSTGDVIDLQLKQNLSLIQHSRRILLESSDGIVFTGGGWCGYKPPYYSLDGGETYQPANHGVHPPNSTYFLAEFNGEVYAGTGYEPYHGQVYRWLGADNSDHWKLVLDLDPPRSIIGAMAEYKNRLFVGSSVYWHPIEGCESTIPVYVSDDGNTFEPTTGIPPCLSVRNLLIVDEHLVARVLNRSNNDGYIYNWNDSLEKWEEVASYDLTVFNVGLVSHKGVIYAYGKAPSDTSKGIYRSVDRGTTWEQIDILENPDGSAMTLHHDTLYIGTYADDNDRAYIYKLDLTDDDPCEDGPAVFKFKLSASNAAELDWFGGSASISGNHAIVGASGNDDAGPASGSAYIFERDTGSGTWSQVAKITASDAAEDNLFGHAVSISGDQAIVGAYASFDAGSAYIFERDTGSGTWSQVAKITSFDIHGMSRGIPVSLSGDRAIVGAFDSSNAGPRSGSAYIYKLDSLVTLSFGSAMSMTENEAGIAHPISIKLSLPDGSVLCDEISVDIMDSGTGTATSGVDYSEFLPQTITFPAGSVNGETRTVEFGILQDRLLEGNETVVFRLTNAHGPAVIGENLSFTLTIVDDDRANFLGRDVQIAYRVLNPDLGEPEGYDPPRIVEVGPEIELQRYPRRYPHLDVDLSATQIRITNDGARFDQREFNGLEIEDTVDGNVLDDVVGILLNGSETTAPGFSSDHLEFDDALDRIRINLKGLARTDFPEGSVIVVDVDFGDHPGPEVSFSEPTQSIAEGVGVIEITVELDRISDEDVWVPFTVGGTATLTEDFIVSSSPLRIPAGTQLASIEIEVLDDNQPEIDEMIDLKLGTPTNAKIGTVPDHRVILEDNESSFLNEELSVTYRVLNPDLGEPEGYDPPRIVEVGPEIELQRYPQRYPHLDVDLSATQIRITNDGARFDQREFNGLEIEDTVDGNVLDDVVGILLNGSETTAPGFSSDHLEFDDALDRIRINLKGLARTDFPEGSMIVVDVIFGEDVPNTTLAFDTVESVTQGESDLAHLISLRLTIPGGGVLGQDVSIDIVDDGTGSAQSGVDYSLFTPVTVTFAAGSIDGATQSVTLSILEDEQVEGDETVVLRLTNAHGPAVIGGNATHTVTIADDDEPTAFGLIGHWKFDELNWTGVEGEVVDSSGQGNHGTSGNGAQIFADGKINNAGEFDGDDDYVDLGEIERGHPLQLSSGGTLMGWFNQRPGHRLQRIFDKSTRGFGAKGYALLADPLKKTISIFVWRSHYQSEVGVYAFNEWMHVAAVIKESDFEIYVNGTKVNGAFVRGSAKHPANVKANMRIGSRNHKTGREFNGFLDDLRIYNRTLSEAEIKGILDEASAGSVAAASQAGTEQMDIVKGKAAGSITNLFLSQTLYEDAEDGKIAGWSAYGDGSVLNVKETSGNRIISTQGELDSDPFRLGRDDFSDWNNTKEFTASFAILMEKAAAVYFRVDTTGGEKYLCYTPGPEAIHVNHTLLHFGLGIDADGEWHAIYRDLARDVANALPGTQLLAVKDFYIYGSLKIDNIILLNPVL